MIPMPLTTSAMPGIAEIQVILGLVVCCQIQGVQTIAGVKGVYGHGTRSSEVGR